MLIREVVEPCQSLESTADQPGSSKETENDDSRTTEKIKNSKKKTKTAALTRIVLLHCDVIKDEFWNERPGLLQD